MLDKSDSSKSGAASGQMFDEIRMVLIGKTGNGKSTAANTVLGKPLCKPARGMSSGTDKCDWHQAYRHGIKIQVTDTPGVCDTHRSKDEVQREIAKCLATCTPGPHAILMILRCDRRFTDEEYECYQELKTLFGEKLRNYMILVFNGLDELQQGGMTIEDELKRAPPKLRQVVGEARGRYIAFNNLASEVDRLKQGDQLVEMVRSLIIDNNFDCFTNDLVDKFEAKIQDEMEAEDKTREEIKEDIIKERTPSFFGVLLNALTFGLIPQHVCNVM